MIKVGGSLIMPRKFKEDGKGDDPERQHLLPCTSDIPVYNSVNADSIITNNIKIYKRRWWILALFSALAFNQSMVWIIWSTISESAKAVFGWNDGTIALLVDWGNIPFVVLGIPICWLLNKKGLKINVILCAALTFAGTGLRCISQESHIATPLIHVGQILNGISGVALTSAPSQLSAVWFPTNERTTATSISILCNFMGICLGFLIGPMVLSDSGLPPCQNEMWGNLTHDCSNYTTVQFRVFMHAHRHRIMCLMYFQFLFSAILLLATSLYFPDKPPLPPTASAQLERLDFKTSFQILKKNKNFWIIALGYAVTNATFGNWLSMIGTVLQPLNITQNEASKMGMFSTLAGCILSLIMARIVDLMGGFIKLSLFILLTIGCVNSVVYSLVYMSILPTKLALLYPIAIIIGILSYSPGPLYMELTSEVTYPVSEGTVGTCLQILVNFFGSIFLSILLIPNVGISWMNWCLVAAALIGIVLVILQKETYQRSNIDKTSLKYESDVSA